MGSTEEEKQREWKMQGDARDEGGEKREAQELPVTLPPGHQRRQ